MIAICKREIKSYFNSVIGWLFMAANLCLAGMYFFAMNLSYGYGTLVYTVSNVVFLLLLTSPILSMRILAEERKQKTDQLILTAPVSVGSIVMGKYLALAFIFTVPTLIICLFPLILSSFGTVAMGESYTAILAYYLFGLACLAVGMFISSLTESQVIAAVLTFAALFLGYMMGGICSLLSSTGNLLTKILAVYDFNTRLNALLQGTLDLKAVLWFLTLIVLMLFFTVQSIQKRRYQMSVKTLKLGAYSGTMIVIVAVAAIFLNLAVNTLPETYTSIDMTSQKLYSLTDTTKEMAKSLEKDVYIYVLDSQDGQDLTLGETLKRYDALSDHITVEYKDPVTNPNFYKDYTDGSISMNSLIVVCGDRYKIVDYNNIYASTFDYNTYSSTVTGYDAEGQITSAISFVTNEDMPVLYTLEGHDEMTLSAAFQDGIEKENISTETINLLETAEIPENAGGLMILAPTKDISSDAADAIINYLNKGGKILMSTAFTDNFAESFPNLQKVLDYFSLSIEEGVVVEGSTSNYYSAPVYLLPDIKSNDLTEGIYGQYYVFMPYAQAITTNESDDVAVSTILSTSGSAYLKTDTANMSTFDKEEGDKEGTFDVAVKAEKVLDSGTAQLMLYGSEMLFTDSANQMVSDANLKLFTNAVGTMSGKGESVSVPVKSYEQPVVTVNALTALVLGLFFMILLPLLLILAGLIIWLRRRKR